MHNCRLIIPIVLIVLLESVVQSSNDFQPQPLLMFDDDSPYYGPTDRQVDHMLDLLAELPSASREKEDEEVTATKIVHQYNSKTTRGYEREPEPMVAFVDYSHHGTPSNNDPWPEKMYIEDEIYSNDLPHDYEYDNLHYDYDGDDSQDSYMSMIRSAIKNTAVFTKNIKNIFDTIQKVTKIYQEERSRILNNDTILNLMGIENRTLEYDPNSSITTTLLSVVLDPPSLEKMVQVGQSAENEDQILTGLTAILLGSEARSSYGTALTLDPVTIIALLTLAAYLIRAVFQVLNPPTAPTGRKTRSLYDTLDNITLPWGLSEWPDVMSRVHNYISVADYESDSFARSMPDNQEDDQNDMHVRDVDVNVVIHKGDHAVHIATDNIDRNDHAAIPKTDNEVHTVIPMMNDNVDTAMQNTDDNVGTAMPKTEDNVHTAMPKTEDNVHTVMPNTDRYIHTAIPNTDHYIHMTSNSLQQLNHPQQSGVLSVPGSMATMTKLLKEGHEGCIRLYVCDQLAHRNIFSYSMDDLLVAGVGYYYADADIWQLLNPGRGAEGSRDICSLPRSQCSEGTIAEARQLSDLFRKISSKLISFWDTTREAKQRSTARKRTQQRESKQ